MKHANTFSKLIIIGLSGFLFILLNSCSQKVRFSRSSIVPAAEGTVKIKKDDNKNYSINISVTHLADPEKLQPPKRNYVVWMATAENSTKNLGQLKSSTGFLSKTLKASLHTVTPFKPTRIFITAEDGGSVSYPYGQTVLTTKELR